MKKVTALFVSALLSTFPVKAIDDVLNEIDYKPHTTLPLSEKQPQEIVSISTAEGIKQTQQNWSYYVEDLAILLGKYVTSNLPEIILEYAIGNKAHQEFLKKFLKGRLIYRKYPTDDSGISLPIAELENPLEGTFDLSKCGDAGRYLKISTGYRRVVKPEKEIEIWITPRFLIEEELDTTTSYFKYIADEWAPDAEVGLFCNRSRGRLYICGYLTSENMENLSKKNLYENFSCSNAKAQGENPRALALDYPFMRFSIVFE